jgi:hypothetical protein
MHRSDGRRWRVGVNLVSLALLDQRAIDIRDWRRGSFVGSGYFGLLRQGTRSRSRFLPVPRVRRVSEELALSLLPSRWVRGWMSRRKQMADEW